AALLAVLQRRGGAARLGAAAGQRLAPLDRHGAGFAAGHRAGGGRDGNRRPDLRGGAAVGRRAVRAGRGRRPGLVSGGQAAGIPPGGPAARSSVKACSPRRICSGDAPIAWAMAVADRAAHTLPPGRPGGVAGIVAGATISCVVPRSTSTIIGLPAASRSVTA